MSAGGQGWASALFNDCEITEQFSDATMFASFARFEQALINGLATAGLVDLADAPHLLNEIASFVPDETAIREAVVRDGLPVPEYLRQLRAHVSGPGSAMLHHGATSQDLIDTASVEALIKVSDILANRLDNLLALIETLIARDGGNVLQAITRMQPALPFRASDRLMTWKAPLETLRGRLPDLRHRTNILQFGGAVGDLQALGDKANTVAQTIADQLEIRWVGHSWHSTRGPMIAHASWMSELAGSLGKIGQDIALMALRGGSDIQLSGGGSSSAMPHKQNPVNAERLVTLARFNATLISGMHHAQIHEMERSGAAWMLEWMILPQICETTAASLSAACALIQSIEHIGEPA